MAKTILKKSINNYKSNYRKNRLISLYLIFIVLSLSIIPIFSVKSEEIEWEIVLTINEDSGKNDNVVFGESSYASDGYPNDNYDIPKTIPPIEPYIRAWFDDGLTAPYDKLWKDYRTYNDVYKIWDLSIQWVPTDYVTPTNVTINWDKSLFNSIEYDSVFLCDVNNQTLADMLIEDDYTFFCNAMYPIDFKIICSVQHTLNVIINGNGSVIKNPDMSQYFYGSIVNLTAIADQGWGFVNWSGDISSGDSSVSIVMDDDKNITASFSNDCYILDINILGNGSVLISPDQSCYIVGSIVNLTASADPGWVFDIWSGDISSNNESVSIEINDDLFIDAIFVEEEFTLTVNIDGSGLVLVNPEQISYLKNTNIELQAIPNSGWKFEQWSGDITGSNANTNFIITQNTNVTATFTKKTSSGGGGGSSYIPSEDETYPVAKHGGPYYGYINEPIQFDGSNSYDDGDILNFEWNFGDGNTSNEEKPIHIYKKIGNYTIDLKVYDIDGLSNKNSTFANITDKINNPPIKPLLYGIKNGEINLNYEFTAFTSDPENDEIRYIFDWDDGTKTETEYGPSGTNKTVNHSWSKPGIYVISVIAYDNQYVQMESEVTYFSFLIDAIEIDGKIKGYFLDEDGDNLYDFFINSINGENTVIVFKDELYHIDIDNDSIFDYVYDLKTDTISDYIKNQNGENPEQFNIILIFLALVIVVFMIAVILVYRKRK